MPNYVRTDGKPSPLQQQIIDGEYYWDCLSEASHWMRLIKRNPEPEVIGHYRKDYSSGGWTVVMVGSRYDHRSCKTENDARELVELFALNALEVSR